MNIHTLHRSHPHATKLSLQRIQLRLLYIVYVDSNDTLICHSERHGRVLKAGWMHCIYTIHVSNVIHWKVVFGFAITVCQFAVYDRRYCFAIFRDFRNFRAIGRTRPLRSNAGWWWWTLWCTRWWPWQWISTIFYFKFHIKHFSVFVFPFFDLISLNFDCPNSINSSLLLSDLRACASFNYRQFVWLSVVKLKCKYYGWCWPFMVFCCWMWRKSLM